MTENNFDKVPDNKVPTTIEELLEQIRQQKYKFDEGKDAEKIKADLKKAEELSKVLLSSEKDFGINHPETLKVKKELDSLVEELKKKIPGYGKFPIVENQNK